MDDFAYLFRDSASSWLAGRGDTRFPQYERFYRASRAAAIEAFDLQTSNEEYSLQCREKSRWGYKALNFPASKQVMFFLILLYGGEVLVPPLAKMQPVPTGAVLV